jgi:hypothetical protein
MTNRLSHTQVSLFQECPQKYAYQYLEKIKPTTFGGALAFGSAIDKGLEALVQKHENPEQVFLDRFTAQEINGVLTDIKISPLLTYANSDYDPDLIFDEDIQSLKQLGIVDFKARAYEIYERKDVVGFDNLSEEDKIDLNKIVWHCLKNKGLMILETARTEVLPNITEVLSTQEEVKLENDKGIK